MRTESGQNFVLYTRCSTDEQGKKGNSHEYQTDGIRRSGVVTVGKLQEVGVFSDTVSGTKFDNREHGLDAAFKLCQLQRGKVVYLFIYRWDRFGRSVELCFGAIRRFREIGVAVNCPDEWIDYADPSWPLILSVKFGMAQSESMRISDRTKDGVHATHKAGFFTGAPPVGYVRGLEQNYEGKLRKVHVVNHDKASVVRRCFELYSEGQNKCELYRQYGRALGVERSQFFRMFSNPFYCGLVYVKPHRSEGAQVVPGRQQPIITRELFERCQEIFESAEHSTKGKTWTNKQIAGTNEFYLKGVLKCPFTWGNMRAFYSRGRHGKRFPYYSSKGKGVNIPIAKAHHLVTLALGGMRIDGEQYLILKTEISRQLSDRSSVAVKESDAARRAIESANARLKNIRQDYGDGNLTASEYREMKNSFEVDLLDGQSRLNAAESLQLENEGLFFRVLDLLSGIDTVFAASAPEYKNRILRAVFPDGFTIDLKAGKVQTPFVNEIIYSMCSKSINSAVLEIENGTEIASRPVKGESRVNFQTPLNLLSALFAA